MLQSERDAIFDACERGELNVLPSLKIVKQMYDIQDRSLLDVAIISKNIKVIQMLFALGLLPSIRSRSLEYAVHTDDPMLLTVVLAGLRDADRAAFIEAGNQFRYKHQYDGMYRSAFHLACRTGQLNIVRWFLTNAAINSDTGTGTVYRYPYPRIDVNEPLVDAWGSGYLEIVRELIDAGASNHLNPKYRVFKDVLSRSQYALAVGRDREQLLDLLLSENCAKDLSCFIFWDFIGRDGTIPLAQRLLEATDQQTKDFPNYFVEMLRRACKANPVLAQYLLTVSTDYSCTYMFKEALANGHREVAEQLLSRTDLQSVFNKESLESTKTYLLVRAAACGSESIVAAILACGVPVDAFLRSTRSLYDTKRVHWLYMTALSVASDPAVINILLDAKASVDPPECRNVLRGACEKLRPDALKLLLDAGASVIDLWDIFRPSCTSIDCPADGVDSLIAVVNLLLDAGTGMQRFLFDTLDSDQYEGYLTVSKRSPDAPWLRMVVMGALLARDPSLVQSCDQGGRTPLMAMAKYFGMKVDFPRMLLNAGANPRAVDCEGKSVLFHMFTSCNFGRGMFNGNARQVVRMLLEAGTDPTLVAADGETLMMRLLSVQFSGDSVRSDCIGCIFIGDILQFIHAHPRVCADAGADTRGDDKDAYDGAVRPAKLQRTEE